MPTDDPQTCVRHFWSIFERHALVCLLRRRSNNSCDAQHRVRVAIESYFPVISQLPTNAVASWLSPPKLKILQWRGRGSGNGWTSDCKLCYFKTGFSLSESAKGAFRDHAPLEYWSGVPHSRPWTIGRHRGASWPPQMPHRVQFQKKYNIINKSDLLKKDVSICRCES